ncbi:MAG: acyl-CoA desaturase [Proteobacteria bacterium]|nr:acyl-CoA desaturase [Pseudomonadota bacterium]
MNEPRRPGESTPFRLPFYYARNRGERQVLIINTLAIVIPFLGFVAAMVHGALYGFNPAAIGIFAVFYVLTVLGITVGYHRLFTHRAFEASRPVEYLFAVLGSMALQGPLLKWVALHRCHHQYSDTDQDVHSPHNRANSRMGRLRGAFHAHMGWFFDPDPTDLYRYVKDLKRDPMLCRISDQFTFWAIMGVVIPALLGLWLIGGSEGFFLGFIWGGLMRLFVVHHVTWSINSVCHLWGSRSYNTEDQSRNNWLFGLLALGEGWHNNHHAFPVSARHGLKWWQLDISWIVIRTLEKLGLAWKVRLPASY